MTRKVIECERFEQYTERRNWYRHTGVGFMTEIEICKIQKGVRGLLASVKELFTPRKNDRFD